MKYILTKEFRASVSDEMRLKLADALVGSKQHKQALVDDDSADLTGPERSIGMCCLARFESCLNDTPVLHFLHDGVSLKTPNDICDNVDGFEPLRGDLNGELLEDISVAHEDARGLNFSFDTLNDCRMTHAEIRELLFNGELEL